MKLIFKYITNIILLLVAMILLFSLIREYKQNQLITETPKDNIIIAKDHEEEIKSKEYTDEEIRLEVIQDIINQSTGNDIHKLEMRRMLLEDFEESK